MESFEPIDSERVLMYTCGPTVYNFAHLGNFRAYLFEDILRRTLKFAGYRVTQVMNLTDVDDKTIRDSRQAGIPLHDFTATYKSAFFDDVDALRIERAEHYPAATDHIPEMIALIRTLIDKGFAYIGDDRSVYFSINKCEGYGKLANVDPSRQRAGQRVRSDEYGKESIADFALWKHWDEADGDVFWESPWGRGRPGWHIECSAMSMKYLGNHFDMHTGGVDNMFPHHEDEIAQSECASGEPFVNYWLHCAHLIVNGEKMSKSLGNFYTLRDVLEMGYSGREIRWLLIGSHYRQQLNFTIDSLNAARAALERVDEFGRRMMELTTDADAGPEFADEAIQSSLEAFTAGIAEDLNMPVAMAAFFDFMKAVNRAIDDHRIGGEPVRKLLDHCRRLDQVFGALDTDEAGDAIPADIQKLVDDRLAARTIRDYQKADALRDRIMAAGWKVEDTPKGARLIRIRS